MPSGSKFPHAIKLQREGNALPFPFSPSPVPGKCNRMAGQRAAATTCKDEKVQSM